MKRTLLVLLSLIFLLCSFGCTAQKNAPVGNSIFTDEFFADVVEIRDTSCGQVSAEQMEPVIAYLKSLTLTPTDERLSTENENGEQLYGLDLLTFRKSDGTEITVLRNHAMMNSVNGSSYVVADTDLNAGLREAFGQA